MWKWIGPRVKTNQALLVWIRASLGAELLGEPPETPGLDVGPGSFLNPLPQLPHLYIWETCDDHQLTALEGCLHEFNTSVSRTVSVTQ